MAQGILLQRYLWLADLIYRNDGITREEINRNWYASELNEQKEREIPERTFHRHREAIKNLFEIEIVCNRKGNRTYHIKNDDDIRSNRIKAWIINSFALNSVLREAYNLKDRILFETIPSGYEFLTPIIEAMRESNVITLIYQSFRRDHPLPYSIEPYCLKIYKQRWYVLGRRTDSDNIHIFALDRIQAIEYPGKHFKFPDDFDAEEYFSDFIGIIIEEGLTVQTVRFKAKGGQQDYIRSLPLHHSQCEIEKTANESTFQLRVKPTYDLIQELLRYGEDVEILSPQWLRKRFCNIAEKMNHNYNSK